MLKAWEWISTIGVRDQPPREARSIRVLDQAMALCLLTLFWYTVWDICLGFFPSVVLNVIDMTCLLAAFSLVHMGHVRVARHLAMIAQIVTAALLATVLGGPDVGGHYFFWTFAVVGFLIFATERPWVIALYVVINMVAFAIIEARAVDVVPVDVPTGTLAEVVKVGTRLAALFVIVLVVTFFLLSIQTAEDKLLQERNHSEELLLNILPAPIAKLLKTDKTAFAKRHQEVTVLFSDLVGFTTLSERLSAEEVVTLLNRLFSKFDDLTHKHGLEKIKTIGDAYMVVGGVPEPRRKHAAAIAEMALDMVEATRELAFTLDHPLDIRIGIHSGPVVAGVIGKYKYCYDLWGDTVNTAARMESHGKPGHIQVSEAVRDLLEQDYALEERGTITVKGKGEMKVYFLRGRYTEGLALEDTMEIQRET